MTGLGCWLCGDLAHWRDLCPNQLPAATLAEHQARIRLYIDRWAENQMTTTAKREAVENEYRMWNEKRKAKRAA